MLYISYDILHAFWFAGLCFHWRKKKVKFRLVDIRLMKLNHL